MKGKGLVISPCYNEEKYLESFLNKLLGHWSGTVLIIDDGSTDSTPNIISKYPQIESIRFDQNRGYGAALKSGFKYAIQNAFDQVITIDSDEQHDPKFISRFFEGLSNADMITGTRFSQFSIPESEIPLIRFEANKFFTNLVNRFCGCALTDSLCGFRAYRSRLIEKINIGELRYTMPLEMWPQVSRIKAIVNEVPITLRYIDSNRNFNNQYDCLSELLTDCIRVFFESLYENGLTRHLSFDLIKEIVGNEIRINSYTLLPEYMDI